jgi:transposase
VVGEEETGWEIRVEVEYRKGSGVCPGCGQRTPKVHSFEYPYTNSFLKGKNAKTRASSSSVKQKSIALTGGF